MKHYTLNGNASFTMTLTARATVDDVLKSLCIPKKAQVVILVNGRRSDSSTPLEDAAILVLFPRVSGE